jgi:hypothetical protein
MNAKILSTAVAALGLLSVLVSIPERPTAHAQGYSSDGYPARAIAPPSVFQAAGPTVASIQGLVDAYRDALGPNNGIAGGRSPAVAARSTGTAGARPT